MGDQIKDNINHPFHYTYGGIEVLDIIEAYSVNFHLGNVIKYILRSPYKNGLEDLKKAQFYLNRYVAMVEKQNDNTAPAQTASAVSEDQQEVPQT